MEHRKDTIAIVAGRPEAVPGAPLNQGLVPASTYRAGTERIYGRDGNPGWEALEEALAALEGGARCVTFSSGVAASAAVLAELPQGGLVVAPAAPYWGVSVQLRERHAAGAIVLREVDTTDLEALDRAAEGASLVWIETPSNPRMDVTDIAAAATIAAANGARLLVDNTFATPLLQAPIALGADLALHSATKLIGGHSDLVLGAVIAADGEVGARLRARRQLDGATPGALEAFLALRGIRTLPVRLERAQATATTLADRLSEHPGVTAVRYPTRRDHPHRGVAARQMSGGGTMIAFETDGDGERAERVCERLRLIVHATSLGGVESLMERRGRYESEIANGTPPTLIRLSVGLEHVEDLWADLDQALA